VPKYYAFRIKNYSDGAFIGIIKRLSGIDGRIIEVMCGNEAYIGYIINISSWKAAPGIELEELENYSV